MHTFSEIVPSQFCVYREYAFTSLSKDWGDGLLDKSLSRQKPISVEDSIPDHAKVELFGFGTGVFASRATVNGQEIDFPVLCAALPASPSSPYPVLEGASINRAYHRTRIPEGVIKHGANIVDLPPTHAYVQCLVIRVYESNPDRAVADLRLPAAALRTQYEAGASNCTIELADLQNGASLERAEVLAFYTGYDENINGLQKDWHAGAEHDLGAAGGYILHGHVGDCAGADPKFHKFQFDTTLIPDRSIRFRSRFRDKRGYVVESPGGHVVDVDLGDKSSIRLIRPEGFVAVGFHEHGWNQENGRCSMTFEIPSDIASREAVLRYAGYGEWRIILNDRVVKENTDLPLARCAQDTLSIAVNSGKNILVFETIGTTGCFQNPGPLLYLAED